ncbi:MAG: hypothetical protein R6U98_07085, partial [Pirellulaceae bacterium]
RRAVAVAGRSGGSSRDGIPSYGLRCPRGGRWPWRAVLVVRLGMESRATGCVVHPAAVDVAGRSGGSSRDGNPELRACRSLLF